MKTENKASNRPTDSQRQGDAHERMLPAFIIHYDDGSYYTTSMADGTTEADAIAYFVGRSFEQRDGSMKRVVSVESTNKLTCLLVTVCPDCDGSRWNIRPDPKTGEPEQHQCRTCADQWIASLFADDVDADATQEAR